MYRIEYIREYESTYPSYPDLVCLVFIFGADQTNMGTLDSPGVAESGPLGIIVPD